VLEAVRISRMAYPNRMPHPAFVRRYTVLAPKSWQATHHDALVQAREATPGSPEAYQVCELVLGQVVEDATRYQLGKTKVFFRAFLLESLEKRRSAVLGISAMVLQKRLRGLLCQQRYRQQRRAAIGVETAMRRHRAQLAFTRQRQATIRLEAAWRGRSSRKLFRTLRAAVRIQSMIRAARARSRVVSVRRNQRATKLQAVARAWWQQKIFHSQRRAALALQSFQRMASQRRQYRRELAEKKEEAKLSNQLAKMQARLQAEIDARIEAEREQERLKAGIASGTVAAGPPPSSGAPVAATSEAPTTCADEASSSAASAAELDKNATISGRLAGAAAKYLSGYVGAQPQTTNSLEETGAMLALVTKDREKLRERLATETDARKRLEVEKREMERKMRLGSAASQVETRKGRSVAEELLRKKDELAQLKQMMQTQALEITSLQSANAAKEKRLHELEKKMSQYDDSFYALEARNVRDRTKMEEMGKAKTRAEEERSVYRLMLEQAHERALRERTELRRDAQSKQEAITARLRTKKQRVAHLEKEKTQHDDELAQAHKEKAQVEEEKNVYRQQCQDLMVQCQSLMEQLSAAHGGEQPMQLPPVRAPSLPASATPMGSPPSHGNGGGTGSLFERMRSGVAKGIAAAQAQAAAGSDEKP